MYYFVYLIFIHASVHPRQNMCTTNMPKMEGKGLRSTNIRPLQYDYTHSNALA